MWIRIRNTDQNYRNWLGPEVILYLLDSLNLKAGYVLVRISFQDQKTLRANALGLVVYVPTIKYQENLLEIHN